MISITIYLDKELKTEIETYFKSKGLNLNSGIVYIISDFLVRIETRILNEKMDEYKLSPREKEIIILLFQGKLVKEIADKLCLSIHTVKNHISDSHRSKPQPNSRCEFDLEYYLTKGASSQ